MIDCDLTTAYSGRASRAADAERQLADRMGAGGVLAKAPRRLLGHMDMDLSCESLARNRTRISSQEVVVTSPASSAAARAATS